MLRATTGQVKEDMATALRAMNGQAPSAAEQANILAQQVCEVAVALLHAIMCLCIAPVG